MTLSKLLEFGIFMAQGCLKCHCQLEIKSLKLQSLVVNVEIFCKNCLELKTFCFSEKFSDNSMDIMRDLPVAFLLSGLERIQALRTIQCLKAGSFSATHWDRCIAKFGKIIQAKENQLYSANIDKLNTLQQPVSIGFDTQWKRSQRPLTGPAPFATTTVMSHTAGPYYGLLLHQEHATKSDISIGKKKSRIDCNSKSTLQSSR